MDTYLNITRGTDVILNDHLLFNGSTFDPNLAVNIEANLVSGLGVRTPLDVSIEDDYLVIAIPWVEGRLLGRYGLEVKGESNGLKWLTYADGLIRYTLGTEPGDHDVTVVSDSYEVTQEVSYRYSDSPLDQVTASVDDAVGTPTVITTYKERKLDLAFHNLKGNGIASIEQTTESMEDGGLNVVTITDDLGNESQIGIRNGHGIVGPQGIPGESAVFDPETGNISQMQQTTGDSITDPMSQKAITDAIEQATGEVADLSSQFVFTDGGTINAQTGAAGTGSANFASSAAVNIADYAGQTLRITLPRFTNNGDYTGYGLAFYNAGGTFISGRGMDKYTSGSRTEIREVSIPENAVTIRTTFWKSDSSYKNMDFSAIAHYSTKEEIDDIKEAIADIDEEIEGYDEEFDVLNAKIDGGFVETGIDITDQFSPFANGYKYNNAGSKVSATNFATSSEVDISAYAGKYLRIAFIRYTSSGGDYAGAYLHIYNDDSTPAIIASVGAPKCPSGNGKGDVQIREVYIPEGAATVKTTFFKSGSSFITEPFSCRIVEKVTGANERVDNMDGIVNGNEGEDEINDITWVSGYAVIGYGNGSVISASNQSYTDYIDVSSYDSIRVAVNKRAITITTGCAFYNASNQCLAAYKAIEKESGGDEVELVTYKVPKGATKFRTTILTLLKSQFKMYGYKSRSLKADIDVIHTRHLYPLVGSPRIYHGSELSGVAPFESVAEVEAAWEALAAAHPDWLAKKEDIGRDASDTYDIHHYEMGWQHKDINQERYRSGMNYWTDVKFKPRRLLLNLGTHCSERGALLAGYLTIKEILESSEEWAQFIKANCIIDIIPLLNPWGLDHGRSDKNANGENINRHFSDLSEAENQAAAALVQDLIPKGLRGLVDLHNSGANTQSYLVSSSLYKQFKLYARLSVQLQGIMYDTLNDYFGPNSSAPYNEHFHLWDCATTDLDKDAGVRPTGQFHWYMDKVGLYGVTLEMFPASNPAEKVIPSAKISKDFAVNLLQYFIAMI